MNKVQNFGGFAVLALLLTGCNVENQNGDSDDLSSGDRESISVGRYLYSGNADNLGKYSKDMAAAMDLALEHINDNGGLLTDYDLELVDRSHNCTSDSQQNEDNLSELIDDENVIAVLGPECSGTARSVYGAVTVPAGVVAISPSATGDIRSDDDHSKDLIFRTALADDKAGSRLATALVDQSVNTVAVAVDDEDSPYLTALQNTADLTIRATAVYDTNGSDFNAAEFIASLKTESEEVDALVISGYALFGAVEVLTAAVNGDEFFAIYGMEGITNNSALESDDYEITELADKFYGVRTASGDADARVRFAELAQGEDFDVDGEYVANAYDAVFAVALAIQKSGNQRRDGIAEALKAVVSRDDDSTEILPGEWEKAVTAIGNGEDIFYRGASGDLEFDDVGDINTGAEVVTVSDSGKFKRVGFVD